MKIAIYIGLMLMFLNCGTNKTYSEKEYQDFERLKRIVNDKKLEVTSNFARPMATAAFMQVANTNILGPGNTASNIDITSNSNNFKIKGDTISGYFPYFGEQRFGGGYPGANHQGIEFKGIPEDYGVDIKYAKHTVNIRFKIEDDHRSNERYNVFITLFPNNRSNIQISSTNRTPIEFTGTMKELKEDESELK